MKNDSDLPSDEAEAAIQPLSRIVYTDYPFVELGDKPRDAKSPAPVRQVCALAQDGDKYVFVLVDGKVLSVKAGYLYSEPGRFGDVPVWTGKNSLPAAIELSPESDSTAVHLRGFNGCEGYQVVGGSSGYAVGYDPNSKLSGNFRTLRLGQEVKFRNLWYVVYRVTDTVVDIVTPGGRTDYCYFSQIEAVREPEAYEYEFKRVGDGDDYIGKPKQ